MRALVRLLLSAAVVSAAACGPTVDLTKGVQVTIVDSGWYDVGIVNGQNKLVPAVSFTLKNVSEQKLASLQVNALFRRVSENDEWGSELVTAAGSSGLPAGQATSVLMAKSPRGYTGSDQSRQEMLQNTHFVDAKVDLFAKYGSTQWTRIGTYPITRQLLAK
jgi:hypothetical protein